jgi:hypothetical protein
MGVGFKIGLGGTYPPALACRNSSPAEAGLFLHPKFRVLGPPSSQRPASYSQCGGLFWRPMPPSKKIPAARKAAKLRRWRATLRRGRAQPLGTVEAPDERTAEAAAAKRFGLSNEQRRRLALRAEDAE